MSFVMTHIDGTMERSDDPTRLAALLDELASATTEHGDVAVSDPSGWTLTVLEGRVVWENVEDGATPRHLDGLSHDETLDVMSALSAGRIDSLEALPWKPGYGP